MRSEIEHIIQDLEILFPGEGFQRHKARIIAAYQKAEIRYTYHEELVKRPYGQAKQIKKELCEKYHYETSTIEDIIKPVKKHGIYV